MVQPSTIGRRINLALTDFAFLSVPARIEALQACRIAAENDGTFETMRPVLNALAYATLTPVRFDAPTDRAK